MCGEVFNKVNSDESRHLAVGFQVLNDLGASPCESTPFKLRVLWSTRAFSPARCCISAPDAHVDESQRYGSVRGEVIQCSDAVCQCRRRSEHTRRVPGYHILKAHMSSSIKRSQPLHFVSQRLRQCDRCLPLFRFSAAPIPGRTN